MRVVCVEDDAIDEAEETFYSEDETVLVTVVLDGVLSPRELAYACLVYVECEWQRVGDESTRQWMYEYQPEPSRDRLSLEAALSYAQSVAAEPSGI